jgi:hypothetical protein
MLLQQRLQHCSARQQNMLSPSLSCATQGYSKHRHHQHHRSTLLKHSTDPAPFQQQQQQRRGRDYRVHAADVSDLLTPHSGYHFDGTNRRFFEGWYFKVRVPISLSNHIFPVNHVMCVPAYRGAITRPDSGRCSGVARISKCSALQPVVSCSISAAATSCLSRNREFQALNP